MRGSRIFAKKIKIYNKELDNFFTSLERKEDLIDKDYERLYYLHYQFRNDERYEEALMEHIRKFKGDLMKYEEILKRYKKNKEKKNGNK